MAIDTETRPSSNWISKAELRAMMGPEADQYFETKKHYVMLGKTKPLTKEDIEATRRLFTGTSPEKSRDFSKANTVSRWYFAANSADRKRLMKFLDVVTDMLEKGEPVSLENLGEKFKGSHIRNTSSTPAQAQARRDNIAKGRQVQKARRAGRKAH